jgi:3'-phosphoadenosine 5'-phosphosulfate sulfotransferase (PAPS reductase)/FAD synthetase
MPEEKIKRCKKCIMPETYPNIYFDNNGVCNFCLDYKPETEILGRDKLVNLIKSFKKGQHDCVVPLSGGKENTYILYYTVKELKLNPIAVNYNSGFQNPLAIENMINSWEILNVPLVIKTVDSSIQKSMLKEALRI